MHYTLRFRYLSESQCVQCTDALDTSFNTFRKLTPFLFIYLLLEHENKNRLYGLTACVFKDI